MLCYNGRVSLYCYLTSASIFILCFTTDTTYNFLFGFKNSWFSVPILYVVLANILIKVIYTGYAYQIALRATFLGCTFALGVYVHQLAPSNVKCFGIYMCVLSIFHYSEFLSIALIQPKLVSVDSFVINHSLQYTLAAITSWIEFGLESYFFPGIKTLSWLSHVGLAICIGGELLRKAAMLTAQSNFNHLVQCEKTDDHILVTHGVYSWCRHPSYVGWFYWSIGTQIILINPFCIIAYIFASWCFFKERITFEEITLLNFFGQQYCDYQKSVGTGIPFIKGYTIDDF